MLKLAILIQFLLHAFYGIGSSQDNTFVLTKPCMSTCGGKSEFPEKTESFSETIAQELKQNPKIQQQIYELEKNSFQGIPKPTPCPCPSKCLQQMQYLKTCGKCLIVWPFNGVSDTFCSNPYQSCYLGCGCPGRCQAYGPVTQTVVLYCPFQELPWQFKKITLCTNCCCQLSNVIG